MNFPTETILCIVIGVCLALWLPRRIGTPVALLLTLIGFVGLIVARFA